MKKITSFIMIAAGAMAIGLTSCKTPEPEVIVPEYELGTPTLEATLASSTSYDAAIELTTNKVTRLVYYLVEEVGEDYVAPTSDKIRTNGFKESIKESLKLDIKLNCHKTYKISFIGQGLNEEEVKAYTDVISLDVITPADPQIAPELYSATKSRLNVRAYFTDIEMAYFKFVEKGTAVTEEELLKEEAFTTVSFDEDRTADYFYLRSANTLANETVYDFYVIGVNSDNTKTEVIKDTYETLAATSVSLTSPTLTATTATLNITTKVADVVKYCLYQADSNMSAAEVFASDKAVDITADYANVTSKAFEITGLTAGTTYKFTVSAKRTSATGKETTGSTTKTFTTPAE